MGKYYGFETLMVKVEAKEKFKQVKTAMEKEIGLSLTNSEAMTLMCKRILSDSITKEDAEVVMKLLQATKGEQS